MGKFTFTQTEIPGVVVIEPQVFGDDRGYFMETYQKDQFAEAGIEKEFVQDNQSRSTRGVLRGLHFQKNHTQGKLVRVTKGEVFDVAVDCRPHSATFGKWVGVTLSEENKKMLYIPEGFAHGFLVLSDVAEFCYKCTDVYDPTSEGGSPQPRRTPRPWSRAPACPACGSSGSAGRAARRGWSGSGCPARTPCRCRQQQTGPSGRSP